MPSMKDKNDTRWVARSKRGGRSTHLGYHDTWEEARLAEIEYEIALLEDERLDIERRSA